MHWGAKNVFFFSNLLVKIKGKLMMVSFSRQQLKLFANWSNQLCRKSNFVFFFLRHIPFHIGSNGIYFLNGSSRLFLFYTCHHWLAMKPDWTHSMRIGPFLHLGFSRLNWRCLNFRAKIVFFRVKQSLSAMKLFLFCYSTWCIYWSITQNNLPKANMWLDTRLSVAARPL